MKKVKVKARRSFTGREGFWRRGDVREVSETRAEELAKKNLVEDTDDDVNAESKPEGDAGGEGGEGGDADKALTTAKAGAAAKPARAAKPAKGAKAENKMKPAPRQNDRQPTARPAPTPTKTTPPPTEKKAGKVEQPVTLKDGVISVAAHTSGEGEAEYEVGAATFTPEAAGDYSVFTFPDGSVEFADADHAKATAERDGATFLDVIKVEEVAGGNG